MKACKRCGVEKAETDFGRIICGGKPGRRGVCLKCYADTARQAYAGDRQKFLDRMASYRAKNVSHRAAYDRKTRYGITEEQFRKKLSDQNNCCTICGMQFQEGKGQVLAPHIDHCHTTGKIRDLLCVGCNAGLGNFKESVVFMRRAIEYYLKHS